MPRTITALLLIAGCGCAALTACGSGETYTAPPLAPVPIVDTPAPTTTVAPPPPSSSPPTASLAQTSPPVTPVDSAPPPAVTPTLSPAPPPVAPALPDQRYPAALPNQVPAVTAPGPNGPAPGTVERKAAQRVVISVHSAAMNKDIPVQLLLPADFATNPSAKWPTFYMLDGVATLPVGTTNWTNLADTEGFFARKNVLVVQPMQSDATFFADWKNTDPNGGVIKWETFLTRELPAALENSAQWRSDANKRAISGLSMGGYGAMSLAARHPGFYKAVASYSGYPHSTLFGMPALVNNTVASRSTYNPDNMYSDNLADPLWAASDPYEIVSKNPAVFNGTELYISAGDGSPSDADTAVNPETSFLASALESASNYSSSSFQRKLQALGVPATFDLGYPGLHGWPNWNAEYKKSWPILAKGLGIPAGDVG